MVMVNQSSKFSTKQRFFVGFLVVLTLVGSYKWDKNTLAFALQTKGAVVVLMCLEHEEYEGAPVGYNFNAEIPLVFVSNSSCFELEEILSDGKLVRVNNKEN